MGGSVGGSVGGSGGGSGGGGNTFSTLSVDHTRLRKVPEQRAGVRLARRQTLTSFFGSPQTAVRELWQSDSATTSSTMRSASALCSASYCAVSSSGRTSFGGAGGPARRVFPG